jgi:hypothetical protein
MTRRFPLDRRGTASCLVATAVISANLFGCSDDGPRLVPVAGVVTFDKVPLPGATVTFVPDGGNPAPTSATVITETDGKFRATVRDRDGLAPGKYKVLVIKEVPTEKSKKLPESIRNDPMQLMKIGKGMMKNVVPKTYSDPAKSMFEIQVPEEGKTDITLNLE